jgi:hypothetical protein
MRVCGTVSQIFNLHRDRIYLHYFASPICWQDTILRYSEICAAFRFGPQKDIWKSGLSGVAILVWFWLRQVRSFGSSAVTEVLSSPL